MYYTFEQSHSIKCHFLQSYISYKRKQNRYLVTSLSFFLHSIEIRKHILGYIALHYERFWFNAYHNLYILKKYVSLLENTQYFLFHMAYIFQIFPFFFIFTWQMCVFALHICAKQQRADVNQIVKPCQSFWWDSSQFGFFCHRLKVH